MLNRPLPLEDIESAPFWAACREGRLLVQKCCGSFQFPPTSFCSNGCGKAPEWHEASGRGKVYSWVVVHIGIPADLFAGQVPYATAFITLDEGPRICANLIDVDPSQIYDAMPVEVSFQPVGDGSVTLPFFRPVA